VTWSAEWPQVLEAGWGLFATVIVGAAFVLVAVRPGATPTAVAQLAVAAGALIFSALVAKETGLLWFGAALVLQTAIVGLLSGNVWPGRWRSRTPVSRPLLLLGLLGAVPWLVYAAHMWSLNRERRADADLTIGIDHYSMQGALALALALLPLLAAVRPPLRPFAPVCAAVAALYLAVVSLAWPDAAAALTGPWSLAAGAWGLALLATAIIRCSLPAPPRPPPSPRRRPSRRRR
jgi:hypothetical protein